MIAEHLKPKQIVRYPELLLPLSPSLAIELEPFLKQVMADPKASELAKRAAYSFHSRATNHIYLMKRGNAMAQSPLEWCGLAVMIQDFEAIPLVAYIYENKWQARNLDGIFVDINNCPFGINRAGLLWSIEYMVTRHVERHGGPDAAFSGSLHALNINGSVYRQELGWLDFPPKQPAPSLFKRFFNLFRRPHIAC